LRWNCSNVSVHAGCFHWLVIKKPSHVGKTSFMRISDASDAGNCAPEPPCDRQFVTPLQSLVVTNATLPGTSSAAETPQRFKRRNTSRIAAPPPRTYVGMRRAATAPPPLAKK